MFSGYLPDTLKLLLHGIGPVLCVFLAFYALWRGRRSPVWIIFAAGMALLAVEGALAFRAATFVTADDVIRGERLRWVASALVPALWLLFSICFARSNYRDVLSRWRSVLTAALVAPLLLAALGNSRFFLKAAFIPERESWLLPLGWAGWVYFVLFLLACVAILMQLEATFLAAAGRQRWQVKFVIFGMGSLFAVRIYTTSQTVLYSSLDTRLGLIDSLALVVACILTARGLVRLQPIHPNLYLSRSFLSGSVTATLVGVYLLTVGALAHVLRSWDLTQTIPLDAFLIFLSLSAMAILLRSDRAKKWVNKFVTKHFQRPSFDYRQVWTDFTRRTASILGERELSRATATLLSDVLRMLSVSVWLFDDMQERLTVTGSTALPSADNSPALPVATVARLARLMQNREEPVTLEAAAGNELTPEDSDLLEQHRVQICARLAACQEFLGVLTLGDRVGNEPVTLEDLQLIQTVADQTAGMLLSLRAAERLRRTREQEAYQNISAFLIHDLKSLASKLSLTVQNLPANFDKPAFRESAIQVISQSVERMNAMCSRLAVVRKEIRLNPCETDLNQLVRQVVAESQLAYHSKINSDLGALPAFAFDPQHMVLVLTNLLANANQATNDSGEILVSTAQREDWVEVAVSDNGCGMTDDFVRNALFRPFQTTKKDGMGVGLFQSKMIAEAHGGRIEVSTEEGKGTTFRVLLPLARVSSLCAR